MRHAQQPDTRERTDFGPRITAGCESGAHKPSFSSNTAANRRSSSVGQLRAIIDRVEDPAGAHAGERPRERFVSQTGPAHRLVEHVAQFVLKGTGVVGSFAISH